MRDYTQRAGKGHPMEFVFLIIALPVLAALLSLIGRHPRTTHKHPAPARRRVSVPPPIASPAWLSVADRKRLHHIKQRVEQAKRRLTTVDQQMERISTVIQQGQAIIAQEDQAFDLQTLRWRTQGQLGKARARSETTTKHALHSRQQAIATETSAENLLRQSGGLRSARHVLKAWRQAATAWEQVETTTEHMVQARRAEASTWILAVKEWQEKIRAPTHAEQMGARTMHALERAQSAKQKADELGEQIGQIQDRLEATDGSPQWHIAVRLESALAAVQQAWEAAHEAEQQFAKIKAKMDKQSWPFSIRSLDRLAEAAETRATKSDAYLQVVQKSLAIWTELERQSSQ